MRGQSMLLVFTLMCACGGGGNPVDAGPADAGPCNPSAQTGCPAGTKCTVRADTGAPVCGSLGPGAAYSLCAADSDCAAGTVCIAAPPQLGWDTRQTCHPLCDPTTQAHLACAGGGVCEIQDTNVPSIGFCAVPATDAGRADGG